MIETLTVLGSGTILPAKNHSCAGYLIEGDGQPILLDCGPGTLYRLAEVGVSPDSIDTILVSHFHLDHVSDLAALLNARWLLRPKSGHHLQIIGPPGLRGHIAWLGKRMDSWFSEYRFHLVEIGARTYHTKGLAIDARPTGHTATSISYLVTDDAEHRLFYSGDTDYNESLVELARDAELAVFECSMSDEAKLDGHLTPRLAATLAAKAGVKRLLLTHFYREILAIDILSQARRFFSGPIALASDLERYPISLSEQKAKDLAKGNRPATSRREGLSPRR